MVPDHCGSDTLNAAIADVVSTFAELEVVKAWGDGSTMATDGTQADAYIDDLRAS